jgi:hypothetical protein
MNFKKDENQHFLKYFFHFIQKAGLSVFRVKAAIRIFQIVCFKEENYSNEKPFN